MGDRSRSDLVYSQAEKRLLKLWTLDDAALRGQLANIRHGVGTKPGEDPKLWGMLLSDLPEDMMGRYGKPSREEWAIHIAMTTYAMHQQGNDPKQKNVHQKGISLGKATSMMVSQIAKEENTTDFDEVRERCSRRFYQIVLAPDIITVAYYLRGYVQLLRARDISLDYSMLAKDLYLFQFPEQRQNIKLSWGQDFYDVETDKESEGES